MLMLAVMGAIVGCGDASLDDGDKAAVAKPALSASAQAAQLHVETGKRLASEGQYERAVEEFTQALEKVRTNVAPVATSSPDADILYQRGLVYLEMGFPDTAAEDFTAVLAQRRDFGAAYGKRGRAYVELRDLYRAVRDCTDAIRYEPHNAEAYYYRGLAYHHRGQYDRAVADLEQAMAIEPALEPKLKPQLAQSYSGWSQALAIDGDEVAAADKLATARELDPAIPDREVTQTADQQPLQSVERTAAKPVIDEAYEHFERGRELQKQTRYDEALIEYTEAIALHREFFDAYLRRGRTLLAMGFADTAIKDFSEAIQLDDRSAEAYRLQAEAFAGMGTHYRAVLAATESLHIDPTNAEAYALRGASYIELGKWESGIADLTEAGRRDPSLKSQLAAALADAYGRRDEANRERDEPTPSEGT